MTRRQRSDAEVQAAARATVAAVEWRRHRVGCVTCSARGALLCVPGRRLRDQAADTAAAAVAERQDAAAQLPGQMPLWPQEVGK